MMLLLSCLLPFVGPAQPADAPDFFAAVDAYGQKQFARCADILAALRRDRVPFPQNGELLYAECLSAAGRTGAAMEFLDGELAYGRIDLEDLKHKDRPGLNRLRAGGDWPALVARAERLDAERKARIAAPLRAELLARLARDQAFERAIIDSGDTSETAWRNVKGSSVLAENTDWLKRIVADKGWPGISLVGEDGAKAAFLIAQHSDTDPTFQAQVLPLLQAALARHDAAPEDVALLTDRVLLAQGKPQLYGSQFKNNDDGSMSLKPVEDEANLDERRRRMGLVPLAEYKKLLSEMYHKPVK